MADGDLKWTYVYDTIATSESSPAIDLDGIIYLGGCWPYKIHAVNPNDGSNKWTQSTGNRNKGSPVIDSDGIIYAGSDDHKLYALNPSDGSVKWSYLAGGDITGAGAISTDGTVIYVGAEDSKLHAINTSDGSSKWTHIVGGNIKTTPAIGLDGTIYATCADDKLYALNPSDGSEKWVPYTAGDTILSSPAISNDGNTVYFGCYDFKLYAIKTIDGSEDWTYPTSNYISWSSPAIDSNGIIYIGNNDGKLYSINPNGTLNWIYTAAPADVFNSNSPIIAQDGTIFIGSFSLGKLYAINPDGSWNWEYTTGFSIFAAPSIAQDGTIYIASQDEKLYAIEGSSPPLYTPQDFIDGTIPSYFSITRNQISTSEITLSLGRSYNKGMSIPGGISMGRSRR